MSLTISLNATLIHQLDLTPAIDLLSPIQASQNWLAYEHQLGFTIDYPRDPSDPRELSEIPEVRLWFIRLDAQYPWLPLLLDWKGGELARYGAMLIPHQFHPRDGIQYNPEALEIWVMHKTFVLLNWFQQHQMEGKTRIQAMTQILGYELADGFFELLNQPDSK